MDLLDTVEPGRRVTSEYACQTGGEGGTYHDRQGALARFGIQSQQSPHLRGIVAHRHHMHTQLEGHFGRQSMPVRGGENQDVGVAQGGAGQGMSRARLHLHPIRYGQRISQLGQAVDVMVHDRQPIQTISGSQLPGGSSPDRADTKEDGSHGSAALLQATRQFPTGCGKAVGRRITRH
jgi:hypothetical protein